MPYAAYLLGWHCVNLTVGARLLASKYTLLHIHFLDCGRIINWEGKKWRYSLSWIAEGKLSLTLWRDWKKWWNKKRNCKGGSDWRTLEMLKLRLRCFSPSEVLMKGNKYWKRWLQMSQKKFVTVKWPTSNKCKFSPIVAWWRSWKSSTVFVLHRNLIF